MYKTIKRFFDKGIYTAENVAAFVRSGAITADQYTLITGEQYFTEA